MVKGSEIQYEFNIDDIFVAIYLYSKAGHELYVI